MRSRAVVIVAFNHADALDRAISPLSTERVVVVDNSSSKEVQRVAARYRATYKDPGENVGFAAAVNLGIDTVTGPSTTDILLLNPDAQMKVADLDALHRRLAIPGNEQVCAIAPAQYDRHGNAQRVSWPWPTPSRQWRIALGLGDGGGEHFLAGSALLLRAEAIAEVGAFDERFFLYAEETDWQRRAAAKGWRVLYDPTATAEHEGGGTSDNKDLRQRLFHAGQETYVRRWYGPAGWAMFRTATVAGGLVRGAALGADRRKEALSRAALYARGPRRVAKVGKPRPSRLRVAHIVLTDSFAGTERYVAEVANACAAESHDITVIGGSGREMRTALHDSVSWMPGRSIAEAVASAATRGSFDIVHTHLSKAEAAGALIAGPLGARLVTTRHIAARRGSSALATLAGNLISRVISCQIAISEFVAASVEGRSFVLHNGVAVDKEYDRRSARTVLLANRLEPEKDTSTALRAWAIAGLGQGGWRLRIAGTGSQEAALRQEAELLGVSNTVDFLGWSSDIHREMITSKALIATATAEPLGLSVLEAMACSLPVIASRAGGHLETVATVSDPWLFEPGDAKGCAELIGRLASEEDRTEQYGSALRRSQRRSFSLEVHVQGLLALYRSLFE